MLARGGMMRGQWLVCAATDTHENRLQARTSLRHWCCDVFVQQHLAQWSGSAVWTALMGWSARCVGGVRVRASVYPMGGADGYEASARREVPVYYSMYE